MQRSRTGPPSASSESSVASLPDALPPLEELLQEARSPGAARAEVDALIAGLAQPLAPEQSPRERADVLLALIEDTHLGDFTGSNGQTVRSAAVEALLALGYPYALEVPPDALERRPARKREEAAASSTHLFSNGKGWAGFSLVALIGLGQLALALFIASMFSRSDSGPTLLALALAVGTNFLPLLLVALGHVLRNKLLRGLGGIWLVLMGLLWMVPGLFILMNSAAGLIPIAVGVLLIAGVALMDSAAPDE